jgi:hypothetical protein
VPILRVANSNLTRSVEGDPVYHHLLTSNHALQ